MAGEIYIADKETLDSVHTEVTKANTSLDSVKSEVTKANTSLDNVKSEVTKVNTSLGKINTEVSKVNTSLDTINLKETINVTQLTTKLIQNYKDISTVTTNYNALEVTMPGTLFMLVAGSNSASMKITVDDTVIYNRSLSGIYARCGIMHFPEGSYPAVDSGYSFMSDGNVSLDSTIVGVNSTFSSIEGVLIIPKPLKFNRLKVELSPGSTSETRTKLDYCYLLD